MVYLIYLCTIEEEEEERFYVQMPPPEEGGNLPGILFLFYNQQFAQLLWRWVLC